LAVPALAIINAYLGAVKGAAFDHHKQVTLGYQANPVFYIDGVPGNPAIGKYLNPNAAVQAAALDVLQNTEVIGGDLLMKRAHQNWKRLHRNRGATARRRTRAGGWRLGRLPASLALIKGSRSRRSRSENAHYENQHAIRARPPACILVPMHGTRETFLADSLHRKFRLLQFGQREKEFSCVVSASSG
jgi:hypothetical protein